MAVTVSGGSTLDICDREAPVIIAGGGLVGLSAAIFLGQCGIESLVLERRVAPSLLPRAAHFHLRTVELFRQAGIEKEVIAQSEEEFLPDGAIVAMETLTGRKLADIIASLNEGVEALSPCRRLFVSQPRLEPILRRRAKEAGAQILSGHDVIDVRQGAFGVQVITQDAASGRRRSFDARYLIGADGAHSKVREIAGLQLSGRPAFSNSMTIYFEADLSSVVENKALSVIYIANAGLRGIFRFDKHFRSGFLIVNIVGDPEADPDASNPANDTSEHRLVELVRLAAGVPDLAVRIAGVSRWRAAAKVADHYRCGNIFLSGDAAHLMPPTGGFGGNTGIQDAHNLAWKLATVIKGQAHDGLLDSYGAERQPIGLLTAEQAYVRYVLRTAPHLAEADAPQLVPDFNLELGYLYGADPISSHQDIPPHEDPHHSKGRPGARAPHVWLRRASKRISTLDLYGRRFVLMTGPEGEGWHVATCEGPPIERLCLERDVDDPHRRFAAAHGITGAGAVLVRPDGFVCWRASLLSRDSAASLRRSLSHVVAP